MTAPSNSILTLTWISCLLGSVSLEQANDTKLLLLSVASAASDGHVRFLQSVEHFGLDASYKVVGMCEEWQQKDIARDSNGSQKINMLLEVLVQYKDDKNLVVIVIDSTDSILLAGKDAILSKFTDFDSDIVFAAERVCTLDKPLAERFPRVILGKRFLSSKGYIGYASVLYEALSNALTYGQENDQLAFTNLYLQSKEFTNKYYVKLDHRSHLFQNLDVAGETELKFDGNQSWIENIVYDTKPVMILGNELSQLRLNYLGNYVPNRWTPAGGCTACGNDRFNLEGKADFEFPDVLVAVFSIHPSPFFRRFLKRVTELNYPKSRISLRLYVLNSYHHADAVRWLEEHGNSGYKNINFISEERHVTERGARDDGIHACITSNCSYYFAVDSNAILVNQDSLQLLVGQNRTFLAPLMTRHKSFFSNFWGALSSAGYYARSDDYIDIVRGNKVGVWNAPYVFAAYLIKGSVLKRYMPSYANPKMDVDMAFCASVRKLGVFMYVTNQHYFGRLLEVSTFTTDRLHNDMYQMMDNRIDWEEEYIHPNYSQYLDTAVKVPMPCPDVYCYPLISSRFAKELTEEMEHSGKWSPRKDDDKDILYFEEYQSVPTLQIALKQIGFESQWLEIIKSYVLPLQQRVFLGYYSKGRAIRNFVVKYKKQSQFLPQARRESPTFTISVALSQRGQDYKGGGYHFVRYNCTVVESYVGHALMYPGRLTHWHEELAVTRGTRYIVISFIEP